MCKNSHKNLNFSHKYKGTNVSITFVLFCTYFSTVDALMSTLVDTGQSKVNTQATMSTHRR